VTATDFAGNTASTSVTYSVTQGAQAITGFHAAGTGGLCTSDGAYPADSDGRASGNPVTFTVHAGPGTIGCTPNCALTITGLGTVTVYANQAGNANYTAAPQVAASVVVSSYLAPAVSNLGASSVSNTSETLSATINPENAATTYFFTYGLTTTPSTATAPKVLAAGVTVTPSARRLQASSEYDLLLQAYCEESGRTGGNTARKPAATFVHHAVINTSPIALQRVGSLRTR